MGFIKKNYEVRNTFYCTVLSQVSYFICFIHIFKLLIELFYSTLARIHYQCQCVINGVADNGLTNAGALLYADASGWGNLNNTCMVPWSGVVVGK